MNANKRWVISYASSIDTRMPVRAFCNISLLTVVNFNDGCINRLMGSNYVVDEVFTKDGSSKKIDDFYAKSLSKLLVKFDLEGYLFDEPSSV